jgi:hypothetical protein
LSEVVDPHAAAHCSSVVQVVRTVAEFRTAATTATPP